MNSEEDIKNCTTNGVPNDSLIYYITNKNYKLKEENRKLKDRIKALEEQIEHLEELIKLEDFNNYND